MGWHQYAAAWAEHNEGYDLRRAPATVRVWLRSGYAVGRVLWSLRVPPGAMFGLALLLAAAVPVAVPAGPRGTLAAALVVPVALFVIGLDGALTVLTAGEPGRATIRAVLAGRLSELGWLIGFWLVGVPGPLVVACGALTALYELVRTEALGSGMTRVAVQTIADRPMRAWVAATGLSLAGLVGLAGIPLGPGLLAVATSVWVVLTVIGAGQLASAVRRGLG